jgi:hypothetical protein
VRVCAAVKIFDFTGNRRLAIAPDRAAVKRAKTFIAEGLAAEIFTPKIGRVFADLEQYRLAQSYMEMPDRKGKVVISLR